MATIDQEHAQGVENFVNQAMTSQSEAAKHLRHWLEDLPEERKRGILKAVAKFVQGADMLEIYGGARLFDNELDEHLRRNTLQIAVVFLELKHLFKNQLPPVQEERFLNCLRAFELHFNDHQVLYYLRRANPHTETTGARYLAQMSRLRHRGLQGVEQFEARLKLLPMELIERFVLFLEDFDEERLPVFETTEETSMVQLAAQAWWTQLLEFVEVHHPTA